MKYLFYITLLFITSSCVTNKPLADKVSDPDYNQRITVENPQFVKKENALGISISIGTSALGGYLAYDYGIIKPTNLENEQMAKVGSGLIGALASYSITRIVTRLVGKNNTSKVDNKNKWLKKLNGNYTFLEKNDNYKEVKGTTITPFLKWRIINNNAEPNYTVKNLSDIKDFNIAFPKSSYSEKMLSNSLSVLNRNDIPKVLRLYKNTTNKTKYQLRYYELSKNVSELKTAKSLFPESRNKFNVCKNINTIITSSSKSDLDYLINEYSNSSCINKINDAYVGKCSDINECFNMSKKHPSLTDPLSLKAVSFAKTVNDFQILYDKFPNRKDLIESKASLMASSIEDLKKVYNDFKGISSANKSKIEDKALSIASSIEDLSKIYNEFEGISLDYRNKIETKVAPLGSSIENLSKIYNNFEGISIIAEKEALNLASDIEKRKIFLEYFPNSPNFSHITKLIDDEEKDIATFTKIAKKTASAVVSKLRDAISLKNYSIADSDYGMSSYSYEDGFVKVSVSINLKYYLSFYDEDVDPDDTFGRVKNIFGSYFGRRSAETNNNYHYVEVSYDLLLYNNRKPKMVNYRETGVSSLKGVDRGITNIGNSIRKTMREAVSYGFSDLEYNSSYSSNTKLSQQTQSSMSQNNSSSKKVDRFEKISQSKDFMGVPEISYKVYLKNGGHLYVKYYPNTGSWKFNNGWNETNHGNKWYKSKNEIIKRIENE